MAQRLGVGVTVLIDLPGAKGELDYFRVHPLSH